MAQPAVLSEGGVGMLELGGKEGVRFLLCIRRLY